MDIDKLGEDEGLDNFEQATKIALIDCDTIAYASASTSEYADILLERDMYTDEQWAEILLEDGLDLEEGIIWRANPEAGFQTAVARIEEIQTATMTKDVELYFTEGRNFRYKVYSLYKANRKSTRYPLGLREIKALLLAKYDGGTCEQYEADDKVVRLKQDNPDKYVLCAVDKDVFNAVAGRHFNYYKSRLYKIDMKWIEIDHEHAFKWPYMQTLMGDAGDNVPGCPGIGKVKAAKALDGCNTPCDLWKAVLKMFKSKKLTKEEAIRDMRLVNMHQLTADDKIILWIPPCGEADVVS